MAITCSSDALEMYSPLKPSLTSRPFGDRGIGLIATATIRRGQPIFLESVMVISENDMGLDPFEYEVLVLTELNHMAPEFQDYFHTLPKRRGDEETDSLRAKFERSCVPCPTSIAEDGGFVRAAGRISSLLNHSCTPNAHQMLLKRADGKGGSYSLFMAVRATADILRGDEVTIPYDYIHVGAAARRQYMLERFGFVCHCNVCDYPNPRVELYLTAIQEDLAVIQTSHFPSIDPVRFFRAVERLCVLTVSLGTLDARRGQVLEQAARVSAYHSDHGRAMSFITMAGAQYSYIEGHAGPNQRRASRWAEDITQIPGYGTTKRGLSKNSDINKIGPTDRHGLAIACMVGVKEGEYLSLSYMAKRYALYPEFDEQMDAKDTEKKKREKGPFDGVDIDELIRNLDKEKKRHDQERLGHGSPVAAKEKSSSPGKGGKKNKKKKR
ncbi:hypothetical protein FQN49_001386 [Arthroderma sp. PD_2]|nr:hypothetical protein FQN49_001386 [Arthroderma sp. PD_2]